MKASKYLFFLCLLTVLLALYLLISGSSALLVSIGPTDFSFGNLLTWLGLIALPATIYFGSPKLQRPSSQAMKVFRWLLLLVLVLACTWGLVSFYLAGNWAFNFSKNATQFRGSSEAAPYFWRYTYLVSGTPIVFLVVFWLFQLVFRKG